jgi:hypothetical protein
MGFKRALRPTNRKVRLLVGLLLAGLFAIQCTRTEAWKESSGVIAVDGHAIGTNADIANKIEKLAKTDHIALLEMCLKNCQDKYQDFTCTFTKQEVISGVSKGQQVMDVKFMAKPFSVAMHWMKNPPLGDIVLYVEDKYDKKMLVRPTSSILRAVVPVAVRSPDDAEALRNTLRPVNMFGFERGLSSLLDVYRKAKAAGDLTISYGGSAKIGDRNCIKLVRVLPEKPEYRASSTKTVIYIDTDYLVPLRIEGFDAAGVPNSEYTYTNVKFNVGLTSDDFTPQKNEMQEPPK